MAHNVAYSCWNTQIVHFISLQSHNVRAEIYKASPGEGLPVSALSERWKGIHPGKAEGRDHIRKQHLDADQLPFYCTLCLFRCKRREELRRHVSYYNRHAARLIDEKGNAIQDSPDVLVENLKP